MISEVSRTSASSSDGKVLNHTVQFTLTANDTAVYIPTSTSGRRGAIQWQNFGPRQLTDTLTGTLSSEANKVDGRYFIGEGESERFTLTYVTNARFSYPAGPVVAGIRYSTKAAGLLKVVKFTKPVRVILPEKPIASTSPAKTYCLSGKENFSEGTERTSIINADGTTSTIYDGRFVCRIKNGKGVWESTGSLPGKPTEVSNVPQITLVAGNDRLINATVVVTRPAQPRAVTGPTTLGTIAWGDRVTENLIGLVTGNEMTVKANHQYKTVGTYTVTVTDTNGKVTKESITVKAGTTTQPPRNEH